MAAYSELAALAGTGCPVTFQRLLDTRLFSPKSVRAMMLRVLDVLPDLFVTHTSTPFDDTDFDDDFFCEATSCSLSLPNCRSVRRPKSEDAPRTSDELEGNDTLPASMSFTISSSLPSYFSLRLCASKSNVASVL